MRGRNRTRALKNKPRREQNQPIKVKRRISRPGPRFRGNRFTVVSSNMRTVSRLFPLWIVALVIFALGLSSVLKLHLPNMLGNSLSTHQSQIPVTPTFVPPHAIFSVDGVKITNTQWHNAVLSAFEARVASGDYLGGTQTDNTVINTQAMHTVFDPIAEQEVIKELGLTTNPGVLYQQWFDEASPQEQQTAQKHQDDASYKQQIAQGQLEKDIVNKLVTLPTPSAHDVYTYYQQHPAQFARTAPQMHLQQIEVGSPQAAQEVIDQLNKGVPFSTVEAAYDISGSFYRRQGGDLGWVTVGGSAFPPEWSTHVLSLHPGQVGKPFQIDGLDSRYYIVKCLEGPDYQPWPFSQVQDQARQNFLMWQLNNALAHMLSQKEKNMEIILLDPQYSLLLQQFETILKK